MMLAVWRLALTLLTGGAMAAAAVDTLQRLLPTGDVVRLAHAFDLNAAHRRHVLDTRQQLTAAAWMDAAMLAGVTQSPGMRAAADDCLEDPSVSALSVRLSMLDQAVASEASDRRLRALTLDARRAVAQRLRCAPTDGFAWLVLARLSERTTGDIAAALPLLDLSYRYAPSERWVMLPRLRFVGSLIDSGRIASLPGFAFDLAQILDLGRPAEIAELYAANGAATRQLMRAMIDRQRLDRRVQIVRLVDASGLSYPVPAACRQTISHGQPGSELELRRPADLIAACTQ